jgi:hypothetical protein
MGTPYHTSMPPTPDGHLWWDWVGCEGSIRGQGDPTSGGLGP